MPKVFYYDAARDMAVKVARGKYHMLSCTRTTMA
jgi:hypothetical protein